MLPFLQQDKTAGVMMKTRKADAPAGEPEKEDAEGDHAIEACALDLIRAVHSKDIKAVASALRSVFEILDSEPHEEGPHTNDEKQNSFKHLNAKAAQE